MRTLHAVAIQRASNVKSRPRLPIPDEDPYSIASAQTRLNLIEASDSSGYGGSNNVNNSNGAHNIHQQHQQQQQHLQQHNGSIMNSGNGTHVVVVVDDIGIGSGGVSGNYDYSSQPHLFTHARTQTTRVTNSH